MVTAMTAWANCVFPPYGVPVPYNVAAVGRAGAAVGTQDEVLGTAQKCKAKN